MAEAEEQPHPFDGQFEPPAEAVAKMNPTIPLPEIAQASIAISLKRIADKLDALNVDPGFLTNLTWDMGRNMGIGFEQGRR